MTSADDVWRGMSAALRSFILRRVRDAQEAEDILQETFIKIHRRIGDLRDSTRVGPWVYQIARRTIIDHARRRRPHQPLDESADVPEAEAPNDTGDRTVGGWLAGMVESLPEKYRRMIQLVEIDGRSQTAAAAEAGLSVSGAKSRTQRGRKLLKKMITECCHIEFDRRGGVAGYRAKRPNCRCGDQGC